MRKKKFSFQSGFTFYELLACMTILAILTLIGIIIYRGVVNKARDEKRKIDLHAIQKAYEVNYNDRLEKYEPLDDSKFASGIVPKPPEGGQYSGLLSFNASGFKVCTALEDHPSRICSLPSDTCYCVRSSRGTPVPSEVVSNPSCDPGYSLSSNLIAYWSFNDPSWNGTPGEVKDIIGGFHGTALPETSLGPSVNSSFQTAGVFSNSNQNLNTGYVNVGNVLNFGASSFSMNAWIKKGTSSGNGRWVDWIGGKWNAGAAPGYYLKVWGSTSGLDVGKPRAGYVTDSGTASVTGTSRVDDNNWHMITAVFDHNQNKVLLYIDGQLNNDASNTSLGSVDNNANFTIGFVEQDPIGKFIGSIDDFRIYGGVLDPLEISLLYNSGNSCLP